MSFPNPDAPQGTPCLEQGCFIEATHRGRCREHYSAHRRVTDPWGFSGASGKDLPANWKTIRKEVLERDRGICYLCGGAGADSVDHVIPRWLLRGSTDVNDLSNLRAAHHNVPPYCHRSKSSVEGAEAAIYSRKQRTAAQSRGEVVESSSGVKSVVKYPRVTVNMVMRKHGGICNVCGEPGADYVYKVGSGVPSMANLAPVHIRVEPRCYYQVRGE